MIAMRLDGHQNKVGLKTQAGFRYGYACPDTVGPFKVALQNLSESGQDAYVLFVDIRPSVLSTAKCHGRS
jgi:hypothetical protein